MKYLVVSLISAVFLIGICQAAIPSRKCRELYRAGKITEECILQCEYEAYGFINSKFEIEQQHIIKYMAVLMKGKVLNERNKKKFQDVFTKCKKRAYHKFPKGGCGRTNDYYECIVYYSDDDMVIDGKFADALIAYDQSLNI
uniref:14.2 kDa salivary protein n=1 Tax=Phlebotomus duboscqi TaxID=37738 RepID=Q06K93_PHLDU|nr:14.2 kDa salivary protein [Phlebotomus duboscqi]